MNWKLKAAIQRTCELLPAGSETVYYGLQRTLGSLRRPTPPTFMFKEAAGLSSWLSDAGLSILILRWDLTVDLRALTLLEQGFPLHPQFRDAPCVVRYCAY